MPVLDPNGTLSYGFSSTDTVVFRLDVHFWLGVGRGAGSSQRVRAEASRRTREVSGCFGRDADRADARKSFGGNGVIPSMTVTGAGAALLFDVRDFAAGGHFAIAANNAPACESGEAEKPNETHVALRVGQSNIYAGN